ncbi:TPA_asm: hypothetical protein CBHJFHIM_00052 [Methanobrevibacter gottschalkii virus vir075]|uniref:Pesticidal crystal protein domain-containing protein n=1 Tax=Methanobrevibacter gottschalkii TaxID=190974 RepID=A0A1H7I9W9_9EURY|nr:delta endotoxin C-terminal domain-containing protein [Methanobrevibacter gottschalkii]SEK59341.1 hypothetical protein SAMN05216439_1184 [Methanobrevibacter gottschalkii]
MQLIAEHENISSDIYNLLDCTYYETIPDGNLKQGILVHQNTGNSNIEISDEYSTIEDHSIKISCKNNAWGAYRILNPVMTKKGEVTFDYNSNTSFNLVLVMRINGTERVVSKKDNPSGEGSITKSFDFTTYTGTINSFEVRVHNTSQDMKDVYLDNIRIYPS